MVPQIIPIRDLKNTSRISEMCKQTNEPIFITKNGYSDMVVMSIDTYEEKLSMLEVYRELAISEEQFRDGKFRDAKEALSDIRKKHKL